MKKHLVISCAGNNSLHKNWLQGDEPNFDLCLLYFQEGKEDEFKKDAMYVFSMKGFKLLNNFLSNHWDIVSQYEYVSFTDDDMLGDSNSLNNLFNKMREYDLWVAQPAMSIGSYSNYEHLFQNKDYVLRYTSMVEIMGPAFRVDILNKIKHTLNETNSGWGLDYLWFDMLGAPTDKFAIIDETPMAHTKPSTGQYPDNINPHQEWGDLAKKFPHTNHGNKIFGGIKKSMEKITFCIPSKNNLRYLKSCIPSIRENAYRKDHDIIVFVDKDEDGTVAWLQSVKDKYGLKYIVNPNLGKSLFGIGKAYDACVENSTTDIFMIFHADMYLAKDADFHAFKQLAPKKVVCSTRIEPPLHPEGKEKIVRDFGLWPEENIQDGFKLKEFNRFVDVCIEQYKTKITNGCFAPWMMYKEDFKAIGMHDPIMKSAREDSDVFNRMILNKYELIQSWQSFVYHLTCRGGQFEHGVLTKDHSQKSKDWQKLMHDSTLEFIRKWGSSVLHDEYLKPIVKNKYNIGFVVNNCSPQLLEYLEPWCTTIYTDCNIKEYVHQKQESTAFDLSKRILQKSAPRGNDIIIEFDGAQINQERFTFLTDQLSDIITDSGDIGQFEYDIFKFTITSLKTYQSELIVCKST